MGRDWFMLSLIVIFSFSTSGCISEEEEYYYSIDDSEAGTNSDGTSDVLFTITLEDIGGIDMDFSELAIIIKQDSVSHNCATIGTTGNCTVVQTSGVDESQWEIGEILSITENGVNICSQNCIITLSVSGPEDSEIVGPTILNTS